MRFVSHLDMTRFMTRIIRRAHLPVWYTEGFNPHLYMTFALPLSLGMESDYEVVDIRITDDTFDILSIPERLNAVCPPYIHFFDAFEPVLKAGDVALADFKVDFDDGGILEKPLSEFLRQDSITVEKRTKKGDIKTLEISDKIVSFKTENKDGNTRLSVTLPAGSNENINPELLLNKFFESGNFYCYIITRTAILDKDRNLFR